MLTNLMPALAKAMGGSMSDQQLRAMMQALGNCNQPLEHRGTVGVTPQMPPSTGGGTYNSDYWNIDEYGDVFNINNVNNRQGDTFTYLNNNTFNNVNNTRYGDSNTYNEYNDFSYSYSGDAFYDFSDRSTIRLGDVFNYAGDTIINIVNNPPGQRGERGERGDRGERGTDGDRGADGVNGERGTDGLTIVGPPGPPGSAGRDGTDGAQGPAGPPGITTVVYVGNPGADPGDRNRPRPHSLTYVKKVVPVYGTIYFLAGVECVDGALQPVQGSARVLTGVNVTENTLQVLLAPT